MRAVRIFLGSLLKILFHPVVLISLFGPLILSVNLLSLRDSLSFPYGTTEISGEFSGLKEVLSNVYVYALIDYNTQLYTLMLAWIVFYVEVCGIAIKLLRRYTISRMASAVNQSTLSLIFCICIVLLFFGGIVVFFSGALSGPGTVLHYLPNQMHISGGITVPPFDSYITWLRGLIICSGGLLSVWEMKVLPRILESSGD